LDASGCGYGPVREAEVLLHQLSGEDLVVAGLGALQIMLT